MTHRDHSFSLSLIIFVAILVGTSPFSLDVFADHHNTVTASKTTASEPLERMISQTDVEVRLFSGDFEEWGNAWRDTSPMQMTFRWKTKYDKVGSASWQVLDTAGDVVATGRAGKARDAENEYQYFNIDFASIAAGKTIRPLHYWVQLITFERPEVSMAATQGMAMRPKVKEGVTMQRSTRDYRVLKRHGRLPAPVSVSIIDSTSDTHFTETGLDPSLLDSLNIKIDLQELDILGSGYDEDPYLMIAIVLADGTTIVPEITGAPPQVTFGNSTVRVLTANKTHENVPGGDPGDEIAIPPSTGQFEATIRPIGLPLARSLGATEAQLRMLRENTKVAIMVIGMEEDAVPSTEVMDQARDLFISRLTQELNGIVQGLSIPAELPLKFPDLNKLVGKLRGQLKKEVKAFAKAEGTAELEMLLGIHAWPIVLSLGGGNQDDYIGQAQATFSYQELLDAGTGGMPLKLLLDQNCKCGKPGYIQSKRSEDIYYEVEGRIHRTR
ncbi:MAG: hypothetical protein AB8G18_12845 [Gammaproteobacteria bacterium]